MKVLTEPSQAFLSYTRLDDEYFGGAITSLRRLLELGVRVVTGDRTFNIFQDVDGIEFGQKWKKRLTDAISTSRLLIPIVTPLFFKSEPCRDELKHFLEHEKSVGRDDLILPIYFVTAPVLERPELLSTDLLASEIGARQRYDWRVQAVLAADDPQIRRAVHSLAEKIAIAIARTSSSAPRPAPVLDTYSAVDTEASRLFKTLGSERETKSHRKVVLWVDDRPDNNLIERRSMAAYNIGFVLAKSTGQALAELRKQQFDAIISDVGRPPDSRAGYTLLEAVRDSGDQTPYFIYAGSRDPAHVREARGRGAQGTTNMSDELLQMLLQALGA
jgi:CheY-like chemotaxis protein